MMKIGEVIQYLETIAHPSLQEPYDNAGLITGDLNGECKGIIVSLDAIEEVVIEAIAKNCNLIIAHHPIIFGGLKQITGRNYVEKTIITAIKNDIAIYAIHTNLDNVIDGVNGKMAGMLGLQDITVLAPGENSLKKLFTFIPVDKAEELRNALFNAGGGHIGNYSECSFNAEGVGTFKAGKGTDPYIGKEGVRHSEAEIKLEVVFPSFMENKIVAAMKAAHPYEEAAYDLVSLSNRSSKIGSGIIGQLSGPVEEKLFLSNLRKVFGLSVIRHTALLNRPVSRVALCGGAGSFLISKALALGADAYITSDIKYHEFFDASNRLLLADIGHYESEQFTINLLHGVLEQKFPTFAVLKTAVITNPVYYS